MFNFLKKIIKIGGNNLSERERWLEKTLSEVNKGESIIDVGAGELQYKKYCDHLKYLSQDFGQYDGSGNDEGLQTKSWDNSKLDIVSDITNIPVSDSSFDNAMCIEVLEHVPDPIRSVEEIARILKPGGKLIITAPFCSLTHFAPYFFQTGLSSYWYEKVLQKNNLKILEITHNGNYFEYLAQEFRRILPTAKKYSKLNFIDIMLYIISSPLLLLLSRLSKRDKNSKEILCYGLHIVAQKNK